MNPARAWLSRILEKKQRVSLRGWPQAPATRDTPVVQWDLHLRPAWCWGPNEDVLREQPPACAHGGTGPSGAGGRSPTPTPATAPADSPHTPPWREGAWQTASLLGGRGVSGGSRGARGTADTLAPPCQPQSAVTPGVHHTSCGSLSPGGGTLAAGPQLHHHPPRGRRPGAQQEQVLPKLDGHRPQPKGAQRPLSAQAPGLGRPGHPSVHQWGPQPHRMGHWGWLPPPRGQPRRAVPGSARHPHPTRALAPQEDVYRVLWADPGRSREAACGCPGSCSEKPSVPTQARPPKKHPLWRDNTEPRVSCGACPPARPISVHGGCELGGASRRLQPQRLCVCDRATRVPAAQRGGDTCARSSQ